MICQPWRLSDNEWPDLLLLARIGQAGSLRLAVACQDQQVRTTDGRYSPGPANFNEAQLPQADRAFLAAFDARLESSLEGRAMSARDPNPEAWDSRRSVDQVFERVAAVAGRVGSGHDDPCRLALSEPSAAVRDGGGSGRGAIEVGRTHPLRLGDARPPGRLRYGHRAYAFTAPDHKGRGLAGGLMSLAMTSMKAAGERQAHLWVTAGNPAERIYERLGFREVPQETS